MLLLVGIFFVVGFFFPPAWLAMIGLGIYLFASRKSRRDEAVEDRVRRMVNARQDYAEFSDLYFDAARSYAVAKGARAADNDGASATVIVDGRAYFVVFIRISGGGTAFTVRDAKALEREIEREAGIT